MTDAQKSILLGLHLYGQQPQPAQHRSLDGLQQAGFIERAWPRWLWRLTPKGLAHCQDAHNLAHLGPGDNAMRRPAIGDTMIAYVHDAKALNTPMFCLPMYVTDVEEGKDDNGKAVIMVGGVAFAGPLVLTAAARHGLQLQPMLMVRAQLVNNLSAAVPPRPGTCTWAAIHHGVHGTHVLMQPPAAPKPLLIGGEPEAEPMELTGGNVDVPDRGDGPLGEDVPSEPTGGDLH